MKTILGIATLALGVAQVAQADPVKDTSFKDASGHSVQQLETTIAVPVAKVWWALTTSEGFQTWGAPVAQVTLGNEGMIEASYSMSAKIGDADNIRNRIVAYVPEHLLVLHNEHAPKKVSFSAEAFSKVRTIIELQNLGGSKTRVIETSVGYDDSEESQNVYKKFRSGNAEEFALLARSLTSGPVDWRAEIGAAQASIKKAPTK
jgi:uncharacterized protein YndB with AHSA1/START domain